MSTTPPGSHILVQAILPGKSGLPRDRYVNTFHFASLTSSMALSSDLDAQCQKVSTFYTGVQGTDGPVSGLLSAVAINPTQIEFRAYRMSDPEPREPRIVFPTVPPTLSGSEGLPNEVAVCLSYYAGRNIATRRGRIYIGPLRYAETFLQVDTELGEVRPGQIYKNILLGAGEDLANDDGDSWRWSVFSRKLGTCFPVDHLWVDDAFDTQRRRGLDPTSRMDRAVPLGG